MPNVLKKAIGAVKDQTSISLAKVSNFSNLDIAVLKATTHEEVPVEDRYINEVILLTSSSKNYAAACAQAIAKRIGRTRNWVVALKSLMLVQRIFQNGDPHFPWVVLHAMRRGSKILNLSSFRDDSNRSPWDYTGFVRTFALYLDERLDCLRMGKLHRRPPYRERVPHKRGRRCNEPVCDLKMPMLLDRISYWQRLLDRAIATRPTGPAKTNRLVQISLYSVIRESFDLYRDICDGLSLLHDNSTHMQHQSCVDALQICVKASKQFQELHGFYTLCKSIGVGRTSEYPRVQKVYDEIIGTLQEFLEGQISCPIGNGRPQLEACEQSKTSEQHERRSEKKVSEMESEVYEQQTTLKDLISVSNAEISTFVSTDGENCLEKVEKQSQTEDFMGVREVGNQGRYSGLDLVNFDDQPQQEELQHPSASGLAMDERDGWELVLAETTTYMFSTQASCNLAGGFESSFANSPCNQASLHEHHPNYNNPFLQDTNGINATYTIAPAIVSVADTFPSIHTFPATPMFSGNNSDEATVSSLNIENDLFMPCTPPTNVDHNWDMSMNQPHLLHEQQLWLQQQNKIMARLVT